MFSGDKGAPCIMPRHFLLLLRLLLRTKAPIHLPMKRILPHLSRANEPCNNSVVTAPCGLSNFTQYIYSRTTCRMPRSCHNVGVSGLLVLAVMAGRRWYRPPLSDVGFTTFLHCRVLCLTACSGRLLARRCFHILRFWSCQNAHLLLK